jgi:hypothetical protein
MGIGALTAAGAASLPGVNTADIVHAGISGAVRNAFNPLSLGIAAADQVGGATVSYGLTSGIENQEARDIARDAYAGTGLTGHAVRGLQNALSGTSVGRMLGIDYSGVSSVVDAAEEGSSGIIEANEALERGEITPQQAHEQRQFAQRTIDHARALDDAGASRGFMSTQAHRLGAAADTYNAAWDAANPGYTGWGIDPETGAALSRSDFHQQARFQNPAVGDALRATGLPTVPAWLASRQAQSGVNDQGIGGEGTGHGGGTPGEADETDTGEWGGQTDTEPGGQGPGLTNGLGNTGSPSSDPDGEGGGESDGTVLCTALYMQGMLPENIYRADAAFGKTVGRNWFRAYQIVAHPLAMLMLKSKLVTAIVRPLVSRWAYKMAARMGVK